MRTVLAYKDDFSSELATPRKVTNDASTQWFSRGGPNGKPFRRFIPSTTTDDTYFATNTEISGVRGSLGTRAGSRQMVLAYWYRIAENFFPFEVGFQKVFYVNRTTGNADHRPLIQFGYGGGRGWYSLTNNTENPTMSHLVRFDPFDFLNTFFHSIIVLDLDDRSLIGQQYTLGERDPVTDEIIYYPITTTGTYSLYITIPGTIFQNTLVQKEYVLNNSGGWGTFDFLGGYGPARDRSTYIDIGRWDVLI